jgi:hypothetical protein
LSLQKRLHSPAAHRIVSQTRPHESENLFLGLERHQRPMREAVHWSVFARMAAFAAYRPLNLEHESFWESIYKEGTPTDTDVLGPDERFLEWWRYQTDYQTMLKILPERKVEEFKFNAVEQLEWNTRPQK